jgi:hypothetical protein
MQPYWYNKYKKNQKNQEPKMLSRPANDTRAFGSGLRER